MEKFFLLEDVQNDSMLLFEKDGDFVDESDADLLIATIHDKNFAGLLVSILNERLG